jgi:hypothetical protein
MTDLKRVYIAEERASNWIAPFWGISRDRILLAFDLAKHLVYDLTDSQRRKQVVIPGKRGNYDDNDS